MNTDWASLLPFLAALKRQPGTASPDGDSDPPADEDESDGAGAVLAPSQSNGGTIAPSQRNVIGDTDWISLLPFLAALKRQPGTPSPDGDSDPPEDESDGGGAVLSPSQTNGGAAALSQSNLMGNTAASMAQGPAPQPRANQGQQLTQFLQSGQPGYNQGLQDRVYAPEGARGHELMDNTMVQGEAYNLFKDSMYGNDRREHSMWVISNDGQYSTVRWPWSAETNKEIWKGPAPAGAVAIVHTHPTATGEQPSPGDRDLATGKQSSNIRMPVYVLHKNGIWKADPGGGNNIRVRDYRWVDEFKDDGDSR